MGFKFTKKDNIWVRKKPGGPLNDNQNKTIQPYNTSVTHVTSYLFIRITMIQVQPKRIWIPEAYIFTNTKEKTSGLERDCT
jgi:hypothetical protein